MHLLEEDKVIPTALSALHASVVGIRREVTAHNINKVINHPSVYPWVRGAFDGELDLTCVLEDTSNILLMGEHGGVLFMQHQHGFYEAHTQVLPEGRGAWTVEMVRAALHWMFTKTDAFEIVSRVPRGNLGARALVRAIHGEFEFTNPVGWKKDGKTIPADIFSLNIQDWTRKAPGLEERGSWFHRKLGNEYLRLGHKRPPEMGVLAHRYLGMAAEMLFGGQGQKAVLLFNRWARMSDHGVVELYSERPIAINMQDAIIVVRDGDFYVATINRPDLPH